MEALGAKRTLDRRNGVRSTTEGSPLIDVVVVTPRDGDGELLIRELQRARARVRHLWPEPDRLPDDVDVVFCDYSERLPQLVPGIPGQPRIALIPIIPVLARVDLEILKNCAPHAILHRPISPQAVRISFSLAHSQFLYEQRLRMRINKLDENLRVVRWVERAKHILMSSRDMREDEAYHYMRRLAMERRLSIGAVAATIIDSQEILG